MTSAPPLVRSLADEIRSRSDADLAALLQSRPDLAQPAPADLTALAARASTRASTQRAVDALDQGLLQVLEAAVLTRPDAAAVAAAVGAEVSEVAPMLTELWRRALLWRDPDLAGAWRVTGAVADLVEVTALGLGPSAPEPAGSWQGALEQAPPTGRALAERLAWGPPTGRLPDGDAPRSAEIRGAARWLLDRGVLLPGDTPDEVILPRQAALVLRGGRTHRHPALSAPQPAGPRHPVSSVDAAAGHAATTLLALLDEVLSQWSTAGPRVLRAGGLGVRDLAAAARSIDVPESQAAFLLDLALAAGLLADDGELEPVWAPTPAFDLWQGEPAGRRWAVLAAAWLRTTRAAQRIGSRGERGPVNALGPEVHWPAIRSLRRTLLECLAALPEGLTAQPEALVDLVRWHRPRRVPTQLSSVVGALLREAEWLGVTGLGALGSAGRALVRAEVTDPDADDSPDPAEAMHPHLPAPVERIVLQGDLTAIAPGPVEGALATFLRLVSVVESRGGATVHRFTPEGLRRALDAGWSADDILAALVDASDTAVPQPLEYLVRDAARRHGQVRVSGVRSCVRVDDPGLAASLVAERPLSMLQLRQVAPGVLVSPVAPEVVLQVLRDHGVAPVAESSSGVVAVPTTARHRARPRAGTTPTQVRTVDAEQATALVSALRAGQVQSESRSRRAGPGIAATDPLTTLVLLREAAADGRAVWVGHADAAGIVHRALFHPDHVDGGRVSGIVDGTRRTLSIHRITGVTPA